MRRFRWKHLISPKARAIRKADAARDRGNPTEAAVLYEAVLARWGVSFGMLMQLGNALKDSGRHDEADRVYLEAIELRPADADAFLQRGHLMKTAGDIPLAAELYGKAWALDPMLLAAKRELDDLRRAPDAANGASHAALKLRPDMPFLASVIFRRLNNQYRWRRG